MGRPRLIPSIPCPKCHYISRVRETIMVTKSGVRYLKRRRTCGKCATNFNTYEVCSPDTDVPRLAYLIEHLRNVNREVSALLAEYDLRSTGVKHEVQIVVSSPRVPGATTDTAKLETPKRGD